MEVNFKIMFTTHCGVLYSIVSNSSIKNETEFITHFIDKYDYIDNYHFTGSSPSLFLVFSVNKKCSIDETNLALNDLITQITNDDNKFKQLVDKHKKINCGSLFEMHIAFTYYNDDILEWYCQYYSIQDKYIEDFCSFSNWRLEVDGKTVKTFTIDYDE